MISLTRHSKFNKAFTLFEILVAVTIVGILTSVSIPIYRIMANNYHKTKLETKALIIQNDFQTYMTYPYYSEKYPIIGEKADETVGYYNISDNKLREFCQGLIENSKGLDNLSLSKKTQVIKPTFENNKANVEVIFAYKNGPTLHFYFDYFDDKKTYFDTAYFMAFMIEENGQQVKYFMN